jgi:type I restriction enzyme S subunit
MERGERKRGAIESPAPRRGEGDGQLHAIESKSERYGATTRPSISSHRQQRRIVAEVERRFSVVEELESVVSANLQRATRLRQSILPKAFTGELV